MKPLHPPIYQTVAFKQTGAPGLSDRNVDLKYSREENPTVRELEKKLAKLENGKDALAFNSGMAAIGCLYMGILESGDEVVLPLEAYGSTIQLAKDLQKFGIRVKLAYPSADSIIDAIGKETKLVFLEVMTNPTLKVIDVIEVSKAAKDEGVIVAVDNTFTTPLLFTALDYGHLVVESLTKYIAGHNDLTAGSIAWRKEEFFEDLWHWRRKLGSIIQPFDAWLVTRGMKTLEVRFERQSKNAMAIAEFLSEHPKIRVIHYPGLKSDPHHEIATKLFKKRLYGGVVSFDTGSEQNAVSFLRSLKKIFPSPSLGGVESLATYPIKSAAKNMNEDQKRVLGITPGLIRLSVGLEDINELIEDIDNALGGV